MKLLTSRLLFILLMCLNLSSHADTGDLFHVTSTGSPANINITLCLNGHGPLSCQDYNITALNLNIRTTAPNHTYPSVGIRLNTPGYSLSNGCNTTTDGYCLFSVSDTTASAITVSGVRLGGTLSHLTQSGLVLLNNGGDDLSVAKNSTTFTFGTEIPSGSAYNITVGTQPTGQTCVVSNGSGTATADVTNIAVDCLTLYGSSGTSGTGANRLYTIDPSTGVTNSVQSLPNLGGQQIASDGLNLYFFGGNFFNDNEFALINLINNTTSNIVLSQNVGEPRGFAFYDSTFILSTDSLRFYTVTLDGTVTLTNTNIGRRKGFACVDHRFYAVNNDDGQLYEINPNDGSTISSTTITVDTGGNVIQGIALTANPITGVMYAMLNVTNANNRQFVSLDTHGNATFISNLTVPRAMAGMAFHPANPTC
jgi:hypothetical protein